MSETEPLRVVVLDSDVERQQTTANLVRLVTLDMPAEIVPFFHAEDVFPAEPSEPQREPDLLIVNVDNGPDIWGWLGEVKGETSPHRDVPIMVVSDTVDPSVIYKAEEQGVTAVQQPSVQFPTFKTRVEGLLKL